MSKVGETTCVSKVVKVVGLKSRPELNGEKGVVQDELPNGRLKLTMNGSSIVISVSRENVSFEHPEKKAESSMLLTPSRAINSNLRVWSTLSYFYPFGNTPAKLLIRQVPIHQPVAKILLLGCGDPRHILYTSWCIQQANGLSEQQLLSVTTCDIEPSTIARNIILYCLIRDACNFEMAWSIFYDRVIDAPCMAHLETCATHLYAVGDSLEAWHSTEFGAVVKFCDENTYKIVRQIWSAYARGNVSKEAADRMEKCLSKFTISNDAVVITAVVQAQPCMLPALKKLVLHSDIFIAYKKTGRSPQCTYPLRSLSTSFNPMMFRGADQHANLHYALDPTLGYHIAADYANLKDGPLHFESNAKGSKTIGEKSIHRLCIRQFSEWCSALKSAMDNKRILIHHFSGDLFDLSHALIHTRKNGYENNEVVGSFRDGSIQLLPGMPLEYDVIDTSNVSDHVGLLNLLLACRDLLSQGMHSILYTEFLVNSSENLYDTDILLGEMLKTDLPTFAALTGLTLLDKVSNITSNYSSWAQSNLPSLGGKDCARTKIGLEWTYLRPSTIRVNLEQTDIVSVYTEIYKKMFKFNLSLPDISNLKKYVQDLNAEPAYCTPSMQTFAQLVRTGASALHFVESVTFMALLHSILRLAFTMQQNHTPSLFTCFAALGLIPPEEANKKKNDSLTNMGYRRTDEELSFFGPNPSELILLTLLVPRCVVIDKLNKLMNPLVEMSVQALGTDDRFSSLQMQYISDRLMTEASTKKCDGNLLQQYSNFSLIEGNLSNFKFLACTAVVPSSCLVGEGAKVSLSLPTSMYTGSTEVSKIIGITGAVYSASLRDKTKVSFSAFTPEKLPTRETVPDAANSPLGDLKGTVWAPMMGVTKNGCVQSYSCKVDLQDTDFFKEGGMKSCTALLEANTVSSVSVQLKNGKNIHAELPVALNVNKSTVQISRNKGYFNILLNFSKGRSCPLPSMFCTSTKPVEFSVIGTSRAILASKPKLDPNTALDNTQWLYTLAGAQVGCDERDNVKSGAAATVFSMKETIHCILLSATGHNPHLGSKRFNHFCFRTDERGVEVVLYVNCIRLNVDDGSVVIDAAVCVLTHKNLDTVAPWSQNLSRKEVCLTTVTSAELVAWKKSFPAINERTRNNWKHCASCEYVSSGTDTIPLSCATMADPVVCKCCQGKGLEGTEFEKAVGASHPIYKHFFRAAISPFFNTERPPEGQRPVF